MKMNIVTHLSRRAMLHIRGTVLPEGKERDVYVVDGFITFKRPERARTLGAGGYLLPGFTDAHAHLALASPAGAGADERERVRESAKAHLKAGVLLIREPGGTGYASRELGRTSGYPRIVTGGRFLAPPGGYFPGLAREVREDALPDAAGEEYWKSGAWVKIVGDFAGKDGRLRPNFGIEAMKHASARVHEAGGRIAVHAITAEVMERAVEAGFDSIEHGTMLTEDIIREMRKKAIALVPTLLIREGIADFARSVGMPEKDRRILDRALARQAGMVRKAEEAGVLVLAGTDAGMVEHGIVGKEIQALADAGLAPEKALAAGSWSARRFLGLPGIEEGAPADLIVLDEDPRSRPDVLANPSVIVLDGNIVYAKRLEAVAH